MRQINRIYNIVIFGSFTIALLSIADLIFKVTNIPIEIPSSLATFCSIGGISFLIGKIDYNKKLR